MYKSKPGVSCGKFFLISLLCFFSFLLLTGRTEVYGDEIADQLSAGPEGGFAAPLEAAFSADCTDTGVLAATECWRPTKSSRYGLAGTLESYLKYLYNAAGQLTKTSRYVPSDPDNPTSYVTYKYNAKGQLTKVYVYDGTVLKYSGVSQYNAKGQFIKGSAYDDTGTLTYYGTCSYNAKGRISKISAFKPDKSLQYYAKMTYNTKGRLTKVSIYDSADTLIAYFTYNYDSKGRLSKETLNVNVYGFWIKYYYTTYTYGSGPCTSGSPDPLFFWVMLASFLEL